MNSKLPIWKTLIHNDCDCIGDLVNIADTDNQKICYETPTKELKSISLGNQNIIRSFIDYVEYRTYDNDPIGDDWTNINNDDFTDFMMKYYYNCRRLCETRLVNTRPTLPTSSCKRYYLANNLNTSIE